LPGPKVKSRLDRRLSSAVRNGWFEADVAVVRALRFVCVGVERAGVDGGRSALFSFMTRLKAGARRRPVASGLLAAGDVFKSYRGLPVLEGVTLAVRPGEIVGLLGPNGAGKTTLFNMLIGMTRPDSGRVFMSGLDVTRMPMYRRARLGLGYLPQETSVFRNLTVEGNIMSVLDILALDASTRKARLEQLLSEFSIAHLSQKRAASLSGGERRRLEIARALAANPSFILLDEPFAGIDPLSIADIHALVVNLKERGVGVLVTDHNARETLSLTDRAYILFGGRILAHGSPDEIVENADARRLYLGDRFRI
jgi:lipopolysaccharide export system ATP-binding protein